MKEREATVNLMCAALRLFCCSATSSRSLLLLSLFVVVVFFSVFFCGLLSCTLRHTKLMIIVSLSTFLRRQRTIERAIEDSSTTSSPPMPFPDKKYPMLYRCRGARKKKNSFRQVWPVVRLFRRVFRYFFTFPCFSSPSLSSLSPLMVSRSSLSRRSPQSALLFLSLYQ